MRSVLVIAAVLALPALARAQAAAGYVGNESCKTCHDEAYEAWRQSPHARAMASLTGKSAKDGRCISCHAPAQEKGVAAVGCEVCHGAGQFYAPRYVMKDAELARAVGLEDPGEKSCRVCHDASSPSLKAFDYKAKLPLIDHWSAARKKVTVEEKLRIEQALSAAAAPPKREKIARRQ